MPLDVLPSALVDKDTGELVLDEGTILNSYNLSKAQRYGVDRLIRKKRSSEVDPQLTSSKERVQEAVQALLDMVDISLPEARAFSLQQNQNDLKKIAENGNVKVDYARYEQDIASAFFASTSQKYDPYQKGYKNMRDRFEVDTLSHGVEAALYTAELARYLKDSREAIYGVQITEEFIQKAVEGALLHDAGKIFTPSNILNDEDSFAWDDPRRLIMNLHTDQGAAILDYVRKNIAARIALGHHDSVYRPNDPNSRKVMLSKEEQVILNIVKISEVFSALMMERPYKFAGCVGSALMIMNEMYKAGYFGYEEYRAFYEMKMKEIKQGVNLRPLFEQGTLLRVDRRDVGRPEYKRLGLQQGDIIRIQETVDSTNILVDIQLKSGMRVAEQAMNLFEEIRLPQKDDFFDGVKVVDAPSTHFAQAA